MAMRIMTVAMVRIVLGMPIQVCSDDDDDDVSQNTDEESVTGDVRINHYVYYTCIASLSSDFYG